MDSTDTSSARSVQDAVAALRAGLRAGGIAVLDVVPLQVAARPQNQHYLDTTRRRLGHDLTHLSGGLHIVPRPAGTDSPTEGSRAC